MNKRILLIVFVLFLAAVPARSQDKKAQNCSGTISDDGLSFTCDKDHHVWKVSNPGVLRDMEGHQAKLTYKLTSTAGEIFVTSASIVQQPSVHNPSDSAFRR